MYPVRIELCSFDTLDPGWKPEEQETPASRRKEMTVGKPESKAFWRHGGSYDVFTPVIPV